MFDYGSSNSIQDTGVSVPKCIPCLHLQHILLEVCPVGSHRPKKCASLGPFPLSWYFPWVDMPLIQNPKSAQENDRLFQNLCRKIIFEIQPAEKKSQLVWKKHDAYHTHITLKPRIFWLWLGEAQDWHVTPALDDLASSTGMSVMFADRNFGTLRCTDALQNQTQIELKWQNISESEVMLQRVFLAKQHDQPKQGP